MAQQTVSQSMRAKAQQLAFESTTWNHGRSKVDGTTFYVVPASDGKSAHYSNTFGCTCRSYRHRGACSHVEACKLIQRERDAKIMALHPDPRRRYEDLFPASEF